jgi:hypothetical protein
VDISAGQTLERESSGRYLEPPGAYLTNTITNGRGEHVEYVDSGLQSGVAALSLSRIDGGDLFSEDVEDGIGGLAGFKFGK